MIITCTDTLAKEMNNLIDDLKQMNITMQDAGISMEELNQIFRMIQPFGIWHKDASYVYKCKCFFFNFDEKIRVIIKSIFNVFNYGYRNKILFSMSGHLAKIGRKLRGGK